MIRYWNDEYFEYVKLKCIIEINFNLWKKKNLFLLENWKLYLWFLWVVCILFLVCSVDLGIVKFCVGSLVGWVLVYVFLKVRSKDDWKDLVFKGFDYIFFLVYD